MRIFIYRDKNQHLRSVCSRPFDNVGLFLEQAIGDSAQRCKKLLVLCQAIADHRLSSWEAANRHFQIFLNAKQVLIVNLSHESTQFSRLPLKHFVKAVCLWEKAIAQHLELSYSPGLGITTDISQLESLPLESNDELKEIGSLPQRKAHSFAHRRNTTMMEQNYSSHRANELRQSA